MRRLLLPYLLFNISYSLFAQNVGIGTNNPQTALHINSSGNEALRLDATSPFLSLYSTGVYKGYFWISPGSIELGSATGTDLPITLAPNGIQTLFVSPTGNVGINSSIPYRRLDIIGSDTTRMMIASSSGFGPTGIEYVSDYGTPSTWRPAFILSGDNGDFTGRLDFYTNGTGIANKFGTVHGVTITDGKMGINTQTPLRALHVEGNSFINGWLGIQNNNPSAPLGFPAALGKKITLYPGATGDVGFGVAGNRLQIFADNVNADVALGYDNSGTFVERFAVRGNGAISFNGDAGTAGKILQSNGNASPSWISPTSPLANNTIFKAGSGGSLVQAGPSVVDIPGLIHTIYSGDGMGIFVSFNIVVTSNFCVGCIPSPIALELLVNGSVVKGYPFSISNGTSTTCSGSYYLVLSNNTTATIKMRVVYNGTPPGIITSADNSNMILQGYYY